MSTTTTTRAAAWAVLLSLVTLAACGGGGGSDAPAPTPSPSPSPSPSPTPAEPVFKPVEYQVLRYKDKYDFTSVGTISAATDVGGTLLLGRVGPFGSQAPVSTTLRVTDATTFAMTASAVDFRVVTRFEGSLLMLCDAAGGPGHGTARFVALARAVDGSGGYTASRLTDTTFLRGKTFYAMADCAYQSHSGSTQGQSTTRDASTLSLTVAADATVTLSDTPGIAWPATTFEQLIGVGLRYKAFLLDAVGRERRVVLVEQLGYDNIGQVDGFIRLWLPE